MFQLRLLMWFFTVYRLNFLGFQQQCPKMLKVRVTYHISTFVEANSNVEIVLTDCYAKNLPASDKSHQCAVEFKGDGFCDDACNVPNQQFDRGDCCLDMISNDYCSFCFFLSGLHFSQQEDNNNTRDYPSGR